MVKHIPIPTLTDVQLKRFWTGVNKKGKCWIWNKRCFVNGDYGVFLIGQTEYRAHRIAFAMKNGDPGDLNVCHACDNPKCVNPAHLWKGTQKDNMNDKVDKDRQTKGETNGTSILKKSQVKKILILSDQGKTRRELSEKFNVSSRTIHDIVHDKTWMHVEGPRYTGKLRSNNKTGVLGISLVTRRPGWFDARFQLNGKLYCLGHFKTINKAAKAIIAKKKELQR